MRKFLATLLLAGALATYPARAQESAAPEGAKSEHAESAPSDIWKWLNFAILVGVLGWLVSKNMGPVLATRSEQIQGGLASGQKAKAAADTRAAAVQVKLSSLGQITQEMKVSARQERDREADRIRKDAETELARIERQANQDIESAGKLALIAVKREAARLALGLAEEKIRARMSPDTQAAMFQKFLDGLALGQNPADSRARVN